MVGILRAKVHLRKLLPLNEDKLFYYQNTKAPNGISDSFLTPQFHLSVVSALKCPFIQLKRV